MEKINDNSRQQKSANERLAIVVVDKKQFGHICVPYIINFSTPPIYPIVEQVTPTKLESDNERFNERERLIIKKLNKLNEQALFKTFSKEKTVKAFHEKITEEYIEKLIRPYIDEITSEVLGMAIQEEIPMFQKDGNYSNFYETDILMTSEYPDQTRFHFGITDTGDLIYALKLALNGQEMSLFKKRVIELTHSPASFILEHKLYHFRNIDIKKFRPFVGRNSILVPQPSVRKYMETFVRQCIEHHHVIAHGFKIIKRQAYCKGIVRLEQDELRCQLLLYFEYNSKRYAYGNSKKHIEVTDEDGQYTFCTYPRHTAKEQQIALLLNEIGLHITTNNELKCDELPNNATPPQIISWLNDKSSYFAQHDVAIEIEATEKYYYGNVDLRVDINEETDWFDIEAVVILDNAEIHFKQLRRNIVNHDPYFKLPDGSYFIIPDEWFSTWSDVLSFSTEQNGQLRIDKMHSSLIPPQYAEIENITAELTIQKTKRLGRLEAKLRPYQETGFQWMHTLYNNKYGGILADDMGLGKTVQTIALLSHIYASTDNKNKKTFNKSNLPATLIVMPVSLVHNWMNEIHHFAPHLAVYNYSGKNRLRSNDIGKILQHYHIVITSYGLLRNDIAHLSKYLFHYVILDESQYIKNPSSKIYHAVMDLKSEHRLTISGTPIENHLCDLWAQMNFLNPGLLGNASFFRHHFELPITKGKNEEKEEKLKKITAPFILRRTKEMVATDLPPISYQTIYCPMAEEQKKLYEKEKSCYRNELWNKETNSSLSAATKFSTLQALTRLRLIANHPVLADQTYSGASGKFDIVIERICNIVSEGHKILAFSSFVKDLALISKELSQRQMKHSMLTGATTNREDVIKEFNNDEKRCVFLISLKAGGVGLNLTSADYVFILNPWWNPQAEAQAINRSHRIGQTKNVFVYRFLSEETLEEKIDKLQENKRLLADNFITSNNPLRDMTDEELKELFV